MSFYSSISELPITIDAYEIEPNDKVYSADSKRVSTLIKINGGGEQGIGEDIVYDDLDHLALRDFGPVHDLTGPSTLGEFCDLAGQLDLFKDAPPVRDFSRLYRRWAFESAALDLALRQAGKPLHEVVGIDPKPLRFVCSTRLGSFGEDEKQSNTGPLSDRLAKYPDTSFKLDPENDWTPELIAEIASLAPVYVLDLKGHYKGTPVDVDTDPQLYQAVAEAFPEAWLEDPDYSDQTREVLEPHLDRLTWDAPLHSVSDIEALPHKPKAINSKPSRWGSLEEISNVYEYCEREGIAIYGGGQGEVGVGRGHIQYLASLFHNDTSNDIAPAGYNDPSVPDGLPVSPMDPVPHEIGFRWGE